MTTERSRRPRRPHAAVGGRVLVGGLSASVLVGLIGFMARAEPPATTGSPPPVVAGSTAPASSSRVPPTVRVTRPGTPPTTMSHAS
jgi:hypothetical protein